MPAYKDEKRGTWFCSFYYKDFEGNQKQKLKRGFKLMRDAQQWEKEFKDKYTASPTIKFSVLVERFEEHLMERTKDPRDPLKLNTVRGLKSSINSKILPTFKDKPIDTITPKDIHYWQDNVINTSPPTTQRKLCTALSIVFNFAVRKHGLAKNPCREAGKIGTLKRDTMQIWEPEQFYKFMQVMKDNPQCKYIEILKMLYTLLFYSGMRMGEARALTVGDYDSRTHSLSITKSKNTANEITKPKTKKSIRNIPMPPKICAMLEKYIASLQDNAPQDNLFCNITELTALRYFKKYTELADLPIIRLHDLRHSHASMLINAGVQPLALSERLGHEKIETTLNVYGHIYQKTANSIALMLDQNIPD